MVSRLRLDYRQLLPLRQPPGLTLLHASHVHTLLAHTFPSARVAFAQFLDFDTRVVQGACLDAHESGSANQCVRSVWRPGHTDDS